MGIEPIHTKCDWQLLRIHRQLKRGHSLHRNHDMRIWWLCALCEIHAIGHIIEKVIGRNWGGETGLCQCFDFTQSCIAKNSIKTSLEIFIPSQNIEYL